MKKLLLTVICCLASAGVLVVIQNHCEPGVMLVITCVLMSMHIQRIVDSLTEKDSK